MVETKWQGPDPRFARAVAAGPNEMNLAEAALAFAATRRAGMAGAVDRELARLDDMAAAVRGKLSAGADLEAHLDALSRYLFVQLAFRGNRVDYYDPANSYLDEVLDRRMGIPISLSVVYLELGWRLGLPVEGVSFPAHFLVRAGAGREERIIDPFHRGECLSRETLVERLVPVVGDESSAQTLLPRALRTVSKAEILLRMLRNLKLVFIERRDWADAVRVVDHMLVVAPDTPGEHRDRGHFYRALECHHEAIADYQRYLVLEPDADDTVAIEGTIAELDARRPTLH